MAAEYASWQSVPKGRGTWSILSSCVITLVLCVYTAVHLNIPAASETKAKRWLRITRWVVMGIFAPELVAWVAWCQWREAKKLTKEMQKMKQILTDPEKSSAESNHDLSKIAPLINSWTLKHSYFVNMGGFQFQPADVVRYPGQDLPDSVLSNSGFIDLLEKGYGGNIPVLTEKDIDDKSKADTLAKVLSCLQGSWIIVDIIGRVAGHLPITELEINTLAHVMCTMALYAFWWNKPLKIEQPVFISSQGVEEWVWLHNGRRAHYRQWINSSRSRCFITDNSLVTAQPNHGVHAHAENQHCKDCEDCDKLFGESYGLFLEDDVPMSPNQVAEMIREAPGYPLCDFVAPAADLIVPEHTDREIVHKDNWLRVNQSELEFLIKIQGQKVDVEERDESKLAQSGVMYKVKYLDGVSSLALTALLSSIYGALHASLWWHPFPTTVEMWMWRVSCLVVAGTGLTMTLDMIWVRHGDQLFGYKIATTARRMLPYTTFRLHKLLLAVPDKVVGFAYVLLIGATIFCRCFLFVEAFVSLRSQPWSVYQTPNWTQWIPHL